MRALPLLVLFPALLASAVACAEPAGAAMPAYRLLSSSEADSFEPALVKALGEAVGHDRLAELRLGETGDGAIYYRSLPAALTAREGGVTDWDQLRAQPVCVATASPYATLLTQRFGALPREYPSSAHALIGLKLGECRAVVEDRLLLEEMAKLPEWQRYDHLLAALDEEEHLLRISAADAQLQTHVDGVLAQWREEGKLEELIHFWINEVAFEAYVLADTLDCH